MVALFQMIITEGANAIMMKEIEHSVDVDKMKMVEDDTIEVVQMFGFARR
jgi:hypothetical protein